MAFTMEQKRSAKRRAKPSRVKALSDLETEVIGLFVQLANALGQPRSLAEVYGLLFISPKPLALEDLSKRLRLARATVNMALKILNKAGAIKIVYVLGSRSVDYESVADPRKLVVRFWRDQILPQLEASQEYMERIADLVKRLPPEDRARLDDRVTELQSWGKQSSGFVPILTKMLDG